MGLSHSPQIVTDGLIFYYDMGNPQKSWRGAPTTNLYTDGDFSSLTLHPVRSGTWAIIDDPRDPAKKVLRATPSASTQYHGRDIPAVVSTVYSLQMEVFVSGDFNGTNVQMYPEQGGAGANRSYNLSNKGTWQTLRFDGKAATTTNIRMLAYVLSAFTTGFVLISNVQVEQSAFATPFVNGARSNTQAVLDLTNNNTVTATSLTYASDSTFSFNGTTDFISTNYVGNTPAFTHEVFLRPTNVTKDQMYIGYTAIGSHYVRIVGSRAFLSVSAGGQRTLTHSEILLNNTNYHIVSSYDGVQLKIYVNNVLQNGSVINQPLAGWGISRIGRWQDGDQRSFVGTIFNMKSYNRALTAAEVQQNFNALRSRYGI
jgi:hypothetical protein